MHCWHHLRDLTHDHCIYNDSTFANIRRFTCDRLCLMGSSPGIFSGMHKSRFVRWYTSIKIARSNPSLAKHDLPCLSKQCRTSWLLQSEHCLLLSMWIYSKNLDQVIKIRIGRGILIYSAWQGLNLFCIIMSIKYLPVIKQHQFTFDVMSVRLLTGRHSKHRLVSYYVGNAIQI